MNDQMRFEPASVNVRRGETIRFVVKNVGEMPHEFMLGTAKDIKEHHAVMLKHPEMEHEDEPNAVSLEPGKTGEVVWKFTKSGAFQFACLKPGYFEAGMVGTLEVRAGGAPASRWPIADVYLTTRENVHAAHCPRGVARRCPCR
jgi:uncharacterized cupredoxin-like copper-binding protein